jgi:hypothetical protein
MVVRRDEHGFYDDSEEVVPGTVSHDDGGSNSTDFLSILIKVEENTALGEINTSNCDANKYPDWHVYPNQNQILEISVTTETQNTASSDGELGKAGDEIGLVQTLVASKRVATYEGGGKMYVVPDADLPCLDGKEDTVPWYDERCGPRNLPAPGEDAVTFYLTDGPEALAPATAKHPADPEGVDRLIESLEVEEKFLITLWNKTQERIVGQWEWEYRYIVKAYNVRDFEFNGKEAGMKGSGELNEGIKTDSSGGIAGASTAKVWTHGFNHQDTVWSDVGVDLATLPAEQVASDDQAEGSNQTGGGEQAAGVGGTEEVAKQEDGLEEEEAEKEEKPADQEEEMPEADGGGNE